MDIYVTVVSAQIQSSFFALPMDTQAFYTICPSRAVPSAVGVVFAFNSGGPGNFSLVRTDGSGYPYTVYSGAGPAIGYVNRVPSPYLALTVASAAQVSTFTVVPLTSWRVSR